MTFATQAALNTASTDSHLDFFTRNIHTFRSLDWADAAATAVAEQNLFTSNAHRLPWPTTDDLYKWMDNNNQSNTFAGNQEAAQWALAASVDDMSETCGFQVYAVDDDGVIDPAADAPLIPARVFVATLLQAAWLYKLYTAPNGIVGGNEFGGVVRSSSYAPGVRRLIRNFVQIGLA